MTLKLSHKILLAVAVPVVFMLIFVAYLYHLVSESESKQLTEMRRRELVSHVNAILTMTIERASVLVMARYQPRLKERAGVIAKKVRDEVKELKRLAREERENDSAGALREIVALIISFDADLESARQLMDEGNMLLASQSMARVQRHSTRLYALAEQLSSGESQAQKAEIERVAEFNNRIKILLFSALAASVLIAFSMAVFFIRGSLSRMNLLTGNSSRLAAGMPPLTVLGGDDEFANIDRALHALHNSLGEIRVKERAILENATDIICTVDSGLVLSDINEAASRVWGWSRESLLGRRVLDLIVDEDKESASAVLKSMIAGNTTSSIDLNIRTGAGPISQSEWSCTWSDEQKMLYCVVRDVTEKRNLERMKQEFVAMVSHDLRTPLTVVQITHDLIGFESDKLSKASSDSLGRARESVNRLIQLVNNLLDLEKLESGKLELFKEGISAEVLLSSAVDGLLDLANAAKVEIKVSNPDWCELFADKERVIQVLVNLLSNALKFSPQNSTITVAAQQVDDELIKFSVQDEGPGIPKEKAESLFEKFKQGDWNRDAKVGGTGLGLAICKAIVEAHGGEIAIDTSVAKGSKFWFTLPVE